MPPQKQSAYSLSPSGGLTGYGMASYGYGYGGQPASPKVKIGGGMRHISHPKDEVERKSSWHRSSYWFQCTAGGGTLACRLIATPLVCLCLPPPPPLSLSCLSLSLYPSTPLPTCAPYPPPLCVNVFVKMDGLGRDKRRDRVRSGSIVSMGGGAGFGSGGDPQRETELSVAMENLTLEEIDDNVFRMSKDQVHGEAANFHMSLLLCSAARRSPVF